MRVLICSHGQKSLEFARAISRVLQDRSFQVDLASEGDDIQAGFFQYLIFVIEGSGPKRSRLAPELRQKIKSARQITGKRASVVVPKSLLFSYDTLNQAQQVLEAEGVFLRNSIITKDIGELSAFAKELSLEPGLSSKQ